MPDPLGDAARQRLTDAAAARLAASGYDVSRPETRAEPPAIAVTEEGPLGVEPLTAADATPTTVSSRLAHARERDRRALFVVDDETVASQVRSVLADPPLLAAETDGRRTFYAGPDRIPVDTSAFANDTGGYACVRIDGPGPDPTFSWREADTPVGPVPSVGGVDVGVTDADGRPIVPRLVCAANGRVVAAVGGVESLRTPPADAFPYFYRRDPTDKRFRVRRGEDGAVVESVSGFASMRAAGYVPIPMPLVPEHVLGSGDGGDPDLDEVDGSWDLIVVDDGRDTDGRDDRGGPDGDRDGPDGDRDGLDRDRDAPANGTTAPDRTDR